MTPDRETLIRKTVKDSRGDNMPWPWWWLGAAEDLLEDLDEARRERDTANRCLFQMQEAAKAFVDRIARLEAALTIARSVVARAAPYATKNLTKEELLREIDAALSGETGEK